MKGLTEIGLLVILLGIIIVIVGSLMQIKDLRKAGQGETGKANESGTKVAVGGFIGPIPFGFFSDKKMVPAFIGMLVFAVILFLIIFYFAKHYFGGI